MSPAQMGSGDSGMGNPLLWEEELLRVEIALLALYTQFLITPFGLTNVFAGYLPCIVLCPVLTCPSAALEICWEEMYFLRTESKNPQSRCLLSS